MEVLSFYHRKQWFPEWWHSRYILRHRSDLVQGRTVGDQAVTGNGSVGRLNAGDAAEGTWLADGTAGIGTQSEEALIGCYCRAGTAGGTARHMLGVPRVFVSPYAEVSVVLPMANSSILVLPRMMAPAVSSFLTASAEYRLA